MATAYSPPTKFLVAKEMTLGEMMLAHDRQFVVPLNQRPWAWRDAKHVHLFLEDFWNILTSFFDPATSPKWKRRKTVTRPPHFMGTFVFFQRSSKQFEIFDGQQRITAVSMLCAVLREMAQEVKGVSGVHQKQANDIYGGFNEWLRISPTSMTPRLSPNSLFRGLFDALIYEPLNQADRQDAISKLPQEVLDHSVSKKLTASFTHIRNWVIERTDSGTPADTTNFLLAAHDVLRYLFSCIETLILDESYAYEVFGCLNARGETLTAADTIKNELFKVADHALHKSISDTWNQIGENVPGQDIGEYLRRRHIALQGPCKQTEVYARIKGEEIDQATPKQLIESWHQDSRLLRQILRRDPTLAKKDTLERLEVIFDILNVGLAYVPLLAAAKKLLPAEKDAFHQCVYLVEKFVFRSLTIGQMDTAELERKVGEAARMIFTSGSVSKFRDYLKAQIDDPKFEVQFATHTERRPKVQYYILRELEIQLLGGGKGLIPGDHHTAKNHIEHILPRRLSNAKGRTAEWSWARKSPDLHHSLVNRLGNLLVLEGDVNKSVESHEFAVKQTGAYKNAKSGKANTIKCYKDSSLPWPKRLADPAKWKAWTRAEIEQRQNEMAKSALKVWAL